MSRERQRDVAGTAAWYAAICLFSGIQKSALFRREDATHTPALRLPAAAPREQTFTSLRRHASRNMSMSPAPRGVEALFLMLSPRSAWLR